MTLVRNPFSDAEAAAAVPGMPAAGRPVPGAILAGPQSVGAFENALRVAELSGRPAVASNAPLPASEAAAAAGGAPSVRPNLRQDPQDPAARTYGQLDAQSLAVQNERALQGVQIGKSVDGIDMGPSVDDGDGGFILEGLSRLRGVFDAQAARINTLSSQPINGTEKLMALQAEMVKYSLLVDVTSKLTGKSTQVFDTLLKG